MSEYGEDPRTNQAGGPAPAAPPETPAGWYHDPWNMSQRRYWNGAAWTSDVVADRPAPVDPTAAAGPWAATPPPPGPNDWRWADQPTGPSGGGSSAGGPSGGGSSAGGPSGGSSAGGPSGGPSGGSSAGGGPGGVGGPGAGEAGYLAGGVPSAGHGPGLGDRRYGPPAGGPGGLPPYAGGQLPPGGWDSSGRWASGPPQHDPHRRRRTLGAVIAVTAVVAALVGAGIGSQFRANSSTATPRGSGSTIPSPGRGSAGSNSTPTPGSALSNAQASAIATQIDKSLVDVNTQLSYQSSAGAGTGMILSSNGDILTNNHVVDGATSVSVTLVSTGKTYSAAVVGTDPTEDVAVIHVKGVSGVTPIRTSTATVSKGDQVVAIGNAGGSGGAPSVVTGAVQAVDQQITASDSNGANAEQLSGLLETNAPIQPGDSGGPLINSKGAVIGINTAASTSNQFASSASTGFAIPIGKALNVARQILAGTSNSTIHQGLPGFLGVQVVPLGTGSGNNGAATNPFGSGSGSSSTPGADVSAVINGSPADVAGITAGDVITSVNGTPVTSPKSLTGLLVDHKPGDQVTVGWTDQSGATHTATVTLGTGPAN